jgi:hypothetical protein
MLNNTTQSNHQSAIPDLSTLGASHSDLYSNLLCGRYTALYSDRQQDLGSSQPNKSSQTNQSAFIDTTDMVWLDAARFSNSEIDWIKTVPLTSKNTDSSNQKLDNLTGFALEQQWVGDAQLGLSPTPESATNSGSTVQIVAGSLRADWFNYSASSRYTVFSGNGNVDFGAGYRDMLDLSWLNSSQVQLNLATSQGGGLLFDSGNGMRVFDAITLSNGNQILFEGMDTIRFANSVLNLSVTPNDPLFNNQWNLHMMGVQNAWRFTTGSEQVMVGIQDTGLGTDSNGFAHPDLPSTMVYPDNYQDDFRENFDSHGTGVQGIIAAKTNNGAGLSGINWQSQVFQIDVLDGSYTDQSLSQAAQNMINAAAQTGKRLIINMSLGVPGSFDQNYDQNLKAVVANNPDVLFVIAAGNEGHLGQAGLSSPAVLAKQYANVIAVGASWGTQDRAGNATTPGQRIQYANWGSQYGSGLTVMGPSEVISTAAQNQFGQTGFGYYLTRQKFDGTSAAAPNVAGVASLLWNANPNLTASSVRTILSQTASDLGDRGYDYLYGNGFVNADAAVRQAIAYKYLNTQPLMAA